MFVRLRGRFRLDLAARKRWVRRALGSFAPPSRYRSPGFVWIPDFLPASAFRYTWVRSVAALPCQRRVPRRRVRSDLFSGRLEPANELSWRGDAAPGPPRSIDALLGHTPDRDCTFLCLPKERPTQVLGTGSKQSTRSWEKIPEPGVHSSAWRRLVPGPQKGLTPPEGISLKTLGGCRGQVVLAGVSGVCSVTALGVS